MRVDCYRVKVPEGSKLTGFTATGQRVPIVPGEHIVHRLKPKVRLNGIAEALRFLGADEVGRDVHIPVSCSDELERLLRAAEELQH